MSGARTFRMTGGPPGLTRTGQAMLGGAVTVLFVAATTGHSALAAAGAAQLGLLAASWLAARRTRDAAHHLDLSIDTPEGPTRARGAPLVVDVRLRNRSARLLPDLRLRLRVAGEPQPALEAALHVPPAAQADLRFAPCFPRAGHWRVHGVELTLLGPLGLTRVRAYVPVEHPVQVRPRALPRGPLLALLGRHGATRDRAGRHLNRQAGTGFELRELRDYVPGDSLKTVAWKATARRGRPLVRAFEEESVRRLQLLLDIGPTMRAGRAGATPLDRAIDLCARLAELSAQDRVGLTTFDHRVYGHLKPMGGRAHLQRALHHLMDLNRVVDDDLTEIADAELMARVGAFLEAQEGVRLRRAGDDPMRPRVARTLVDPLAEIYDVGGLYAQVTRYLSLERDRGHAALFAKGRPARDTLSARLRLFCALRGIPIPYRLTGPADAFDRGLIDAVGHSLGPGGPDHLLLFTDLRGLDPVGGGVRALRLATARKRRVVVVDVGDRTPSSAVRDALRAAHVERVPASALGN